MNLQQGILVAAILTSFLPVVAVYLRGRSRTLLMLATLATAGSLSLFMAVLLRLVVLAPQSNLNLWVHLLVGVPVLLFLSGYLFSLTFGRDHPGESLRQARRLLILLGVFGVVFVALLRSPSFVSGYDWIGGRGTVYFGYLGKAYMAYLLIGIVLVGHNLEKTYRVAPTDIRSRLHIPLFGIFAVLGFFTFILATGMLYSAIGLGKLIAAGLPVICAALLIAHGYLRRSISDVAAPVSRSFVYTSFTALAAGLFVLAIAVAAQLATLTDWSPDEILIFAFGFLTFLVGVLFVFSNRFQRGVRRFIDRNFYVNRYDYRTQWSRITRALESANDQDTVLSRVEDLFTDIFAAEELTIALNSESDPDVRPVRGRGADDPDAVLRADSPLAERFVGERKTLLLNRKTDDFTYIPIYAENECWLDATASQLIAPLLDGNKLIGTVGLTRRADDDRFTFEDAALMENISTHVAASLRSLRLAEDLAQARESEIISNMSSQVLHDLKNYLQTLQYVPGNLEESGHEPEVVAQCAADIRRVTDRMQTRMQTLQQLRDSTRLKKALLCPNEIMREALSELEVSRHTGVTVTQALESRCAVRGDRDLLRRVLENLITNAIEAMDGSGELTLETRDLGDEDASQVRIAVRDTGAGIEPEFIRHRLFRPLATTKKKGLGLGLYQCRMIVRAHGGDIGVESQVGHGSVFHITLEGVVDREAVQLAPGRQPAKGRVADEVASS